MRRLVTALAVGVIVVGALVLTGASNDTASGTRYKVVFDNVFGLVEGGDVKVGGVKAGVLKGFELTDSEPHKVAVEIEITKPGFASFRSDASCTVRQQSLIGEYFVDCQPGQASKHLEDHATIPVSRTASTIPPDLINNVMRRPYRERFRLILTELGVGLAGRPQDLNEVIRRAHPALREVQETLKILADQNRELAAFITDADRVSEAVSPNRFDVARWAQEASETASIQASRAAELGRQYNRLPVFLGELEPTLAQLDRTAARQIPFLEAARVAAPSLKTFLEELGPFSEASRRAVRGLGPAAREGRAALTGARGEIRQLRTLAKGAPRLAKPLRQLLQTLDDRGRSIEDDPAARPVAPPAPDKTAYKSGQGYTGMESLLNYVYNQTLAINGFDQVGHVLRLLVSASPTCSNYAANPTPAQIEACKSWLGNTQPCILQKTWVVDGVDYCSQQATTVRKRGADGEPEGEAPATPQRAPAPGGGSPPAAQEGPAPSKPPSALPPAVEELLDGVTKQLPKDLLSPPDSNPEDAERLLDFLLRR